MWLRALHHVHGYRDSQGNQQRRLECRLPKAESLRDTQQKRCSLGGDTGCDRCVCSIYVSVWGRLRTLKLTVKPLFRRMTGEASVPAEMITRFALMMTEAVFRSVSGPSTPPLLFRDVHFPLTPTAVFLPPVVSNRTFSTLKPSANFAPAR